MTFKLRMLLAPEGGAGAGTGEGAGAGTGADGKGSTGTGADGKGSLIDGKGSTGTSGEGGGSLIDGQGSKGTKGEKGGAGSEGQEGSADFKLNLPKGVDEKAAEPWKALAKKHGLKGEAAQEAFDLGYKAAQEAVANLRSEAQSTWEKTQAAWLDEAQADKEIGGAAFKENVALADKFVRKFGGQDLMEVLQETGLGRRVEVIKAFAKAARAISEDSISGTTGGSAAESGRLSQRQQMMRDFPKSPEMWPPE